MPQPNLKDWELKVKQLIDDEKWSDAFRICNEVLRADPENVTFVRLRNKIAAAVKKNNIKIIKKELKKLQPLYKERKFGEYLAGLKPLQSYLSDYPELTNIILDAKKKYEENIKLSQEQFIEKKKQEINEELANGKIEYALEIAQHLVDTNKGNSEIRKFVDQVKSKYVDRKLKQNKGLINSDKYEDAIIFLTKLKRIDPHNSNIDRLIKKTKKVYQAYRRECRKDYIFKTIEEINTLKLQKKYKKALYLAEKIYNIDSKSTRIKKIYNRLQRINSAKMSKIISKQIHDNFLRFKDNPLRTKKTFVKI